MQLVVLENNCTLSSRRNAPHDVKAKMSLAAANDWSKRTSREKRKEVAVLACFLTANSARAVRSAGPSGDDEGGQGFSGASSTGMNHALPAGHVVCPVIDAWGSKNLVDAEDKVEAAKVTATDPGGAGAAANAE